MGLQVTLVNFSPNTTIKSADVNANFQQVLNATKFYGAYGAVNNINVFVEIEDLDINYWNGVAHCSRYRIADSSLDRGHCFSSRSSGTVYDAFLFDLQGHITFLKNSPCDRHGNKHRCGPHFSGFGSGFYSHGFASNNGSTTPYSFQITVHDSTYARVRVTSSGASTVKIDMEINVNIRCHCEHYWDNDSD